MPTEQALTLWKSPAMLRRAQHARLRFAILRAGERQVVSVRDGGVFLSPDDAAACDFTISADAAAWAEFAQPMPRPGHHDVIALVETGHATIDGDMLPFFQNLLLVKAALAAAFGKAWT